MTKHSQAMQVCNMHGQKVDAQEEIDRCSNLAALAVQTGWEATSHFYADAAAHYAHILHPELKEESHA